MPCGGFRRNQKAHKVLHLKSPAKATRPSKAKVSLLRRAQFRAITKAISDPTRYEVLQRIARTEYCKCADLRECSSITAATLSHHLKELEDAGLIKIGRKGKFAYPSFCRGVWKAYLAQLSEL